VLERLKWHLRQWIRSRKSKRQIAKRMRQDWDARARENSRYFVATSHESWTDDGFFSSGAIWVHDYVLHDLTVICNGRMPGKMRILEIGCGAGRMTRSLAELFGEVHAMDISSEMLHQARTALAGCVNIHFHQNNGADLRLFRDAEFDFVFSAIVFQHIPRKDIVENYIHEAYRVLLPGSVFKFQLQGHPIPETAVNTWEGVSFTQDEVQTIAKKSGFEIKSTFGAGTQYFWVTLLKPSPLPLPFRPQE